jgi:RHS repeat-associated protein
MCLVLLACARCVSAQTVKVATLTVNGSERTVGGNWDAANISVSFNGYIEMVNYAQYSTPASLASALAAMFTRDYNGYGLYAKAGANANTDSNVVTFHLTNGQAFGSIDYTLPNTSFSLIPSGFASAASTLADSGTVTLSITPPGGSPTAISTTHYGDGATPETIAQGLASAASSNLVTVNANGALLYLTSRQTGSSTDYPFSFTVTHDTTDFPNPSFQIAPLSGSLTGGSTPATQSTPVSIYCYSVTTGGPGPCNPNASGTSGYQANGNLANVSDSVMGTWSYSYDNLNRLTGSNEIANGPYANPYNCWSYDSFGNRTDQANSSASFSVENGTTCTTSSSTPIQTLASYGSNNQISSLKLANATTAITPTYDGAGNMTFDGTNTYLYDAESRVCAMHGPFGMTGYQYDADGNRIGKGSITSMSCDLTVNGYQAQSDYVLDQGGGQMSEMAVAANGTEVWQHTNVTAGGSLIATYDTTGLHFYLNDALGTRRAQTDGYGVLEQTCQSLPFGDGLNCSLSNAAPTEHHFTGKERDAESGLDYFGARYYASSMGRWMSPDYSDAPVAIPFANLGDPQSLNLYEYVRNNPLGIVDAYGHGWWGDFWNGLSNATWRPIVQTVTHPIATGKALGNAVIHPVATYHAIKTGVVKTAVSVSQGDGTAIGTAVGTVGMAFIPGVGEAGEAAEGAADLAKIGVAAADDSEALEGALLPSVSGGSGAVDTSGLGNIGGGSTSVENALAQADKYLGPGSKEIAPGVFRSADGTRQFRMTTSDITGAHGNIGPHVHFESIGADGRTITENSHVGLTNP